jgi:carbonic anhydrase
MSDGRTPVPIANHQNAIKADVDAGEATMELFRFGDTVASSWYPLQYHWHAPSEHTVDGHLFDAELHFVHTNTEGQYAVLGVFFREEACAYIIPAVLNADGTVKTP